MAKEKKQRAKSYEKPFVINGTFEDLIKVALKEKPPTDKKEEGK